jgi:tetratricopeptide (TPR) repeat protein
MKYSNQHKSRFDKRSRWLLAGVVTAIVAGLGLWYWLDNGRTNYAIAHNHYQQGDCEAAIGIYSRLLVYPAFLADFADAAQREQAECNALVLASATFAADDVESINLLEAFVVDHHSSPLQRFALSYLAEGYLALELELHTDTHFPRVLSTYMQLAETYPDSQQMYADEQRLAAYLEYGLILWERQNYGAAANIYGQLLAEEALLVGDDALHTDVTNLLVESYVRWNLSLRDMRDYAAAVAALDNLSTVVPNTQERVSQLVIETILEQADWLGNEQEYAAAVDALDILAKRGTVQRLAAIEPRNEVLLVWGRALRDEGGYEQAIYALRRVLAEEHARLAPLIVGTFETQLPWPFPYAVVVITNDQTQLRLGPAYSYQEIDGRERSRIRTISAVLGISPDGEWIALARPPQLDSELLVDANSLSEIDWLQGRDRPVPLYWTLIDGATAYLTGTHNIPLEPRLLEQLVAQSPQSEEAVAEIRVTYGAWIDAARAMGDHVQVADNLIALQALGTSLEDGGTYLAQLAELYLQRASDSTAEGNYSESLGYARLAIDYDRDSAVTSSALQLIAAAELSLGIQRQEEGDWAGAVHHLEAVMQLEEARYGQVLATTRTDNTLLYTAPSTDAMVLIEADINSSYAIISWQSVDGIPWVLLLAPEVSESLAWAVADQVTETELYATLPFSVETPRLYSHDALKRLAAVRQAWGNMYYRDGFYEESLAQYGIILNDPALGAVISGTESLAAQAWTDLALSFWPDDMEKAITSLETAIALSPESEAGLTASARLLEVIDHIEDKVANGSGCADVTALDAFSIEPFVNRASQTLPQALFQCAQDQGERSTTFGQAVNTYTRLIDEYPSSQYAAAARRELPLARWKLTVSSRGIHSAAATVCENAANYVQAGVGSLSLPPAIFVLRGSGYTIGERLGGVTSTSAVVCVDQESWQQIEVCYYTVILTGDRRIIRERSFIDVRIVNPITQQTVASGRIYGSTPEPCAQEETFRLFGSGSSVIMRRGSPVSPDEIKAWIQRYIPTLGD